MSTGKIRETGRFVRTYSLKRLYNYWLLLGSEALSRLTVSPVRMGYPAFVHIEPTNLCNLNCPECPTGAGLLTRPKGCIPLNDYQRLLNEVAPTAFYLTLYFQGEPYLHKDFIEMIHLAKQQRLFVVTSTNAQMIDQEIAEQTVRSGLDRIIISFDGPDAAAYNTYRKSGDWEKVIAAVQHLKKAKEKYRVHTPLIVLQCLQLKANEDKQPEVRKLAKELGADMLEFKTMQILKLTEPCALLPLAAKKSRYHWKDGQGYVRHKRRNRSCRRIFNACVVTWDGKVAPCCYDKNADFSLGDLSTQSLREIWRGAPRKNFLERVINERGAMGMCRNCEE